MPASTLSGRSVALLRVNLDDYTSEGRSISHGNYTRTNKRPVPLPPEDSLNNVKVLEAIVRSATKNCVENI
jgi:hypothetical protein